MKALSILQPWAHLIVCGEKTIENRTWYGGYRGPLLIHAGKSRRLMDDDLLEDLADSLFRCGDFPYDDIKFGAIVGQVKMIDCARVSQTVRPDREWAEGPWCFVLRNAERFSEPKAYRGQLGFFDIEVLEPTME